MAMDLKRVALGFHNGSNETAARFVDETLKRKNEVEVGKVKPYIKKWLDKLPEMLNQKDKARLAEDALMYSTIFQNYALQNEK